MESLLCLACRSPKGLLVCGICQGHVCKKCVEILQENTFALMDNIPADLSHRNYCGNCFDAKVARDLETYSETVECAKGVFVFLTNKSEQTRLMKRSEKAIRVTDCTDRNDAVLRLGFLAAKSNFNAVVDVVITATKVRNEGYQTSRFSAVGTPTRVDAEKLDREEAFHR